MRWRLGTVAMGGGQHDVDRDDVVADYTAFTAEGAGMPMTEQGGWMVLPVAAPLEDWPAGPVHLNAQQV